ncbi:MULTISPECIES: hypothetical protein [Enterobacterales]|jgi:hypothetical protein|uniref:Uncharacterized protein n=5 Tax=Pantoea TaxID=53335 RepID=A0AAU7TS20_9GAMM|nr:MULTISPECIES: hypothetical protein [Enterobacterales]MDY0925919.1 hypothetical protein [Enterobacter sp. CFBP8995]MRS17605.1 hypothetical protein [Enterobacteriaceae bacterium RIT692]MRT23458.1 hypothetical protein [Enterobacteriaceae bacterium RIT697]MRT43773.1 hypothetical protein [Enterobacteriaceae bacterium RIT702]KAJ9432670.1 hypothetical protein PMI39_010120 [Pantoea sp. YR343]
MSSIKLTVKRLYQLRDERMVTTQATARIYLGDRLVATEEISGMTESPVSKYLHAGDLTGPLRVEWDCAGIADMSVTAIERCPCCQDHEPE